MIDLYIMLNNNLNELSEAKENLNPKQQAKNVKTKLHHTNATVTYQ